MAAIPLSTEIGPPISGARLQMDGMGGIQGWQWLYLIEAVPALLLAFVTYFYLTDRPSDAHWFADDERKWLVDRHVRRTSARIVKRSMRSASRKRCSIRACSPSH